MNKMHDAISLSEAKRRSRQSAQAPGGLLVLSPSSPLLSARRMIEMRYQVEGVRTLHHQQGTFFRWATSHYREETYEAMRAEAYAFLDAAKRSDEDGKLYDFNPNKTKVANVLEALAAAAQLPSTTTPPAWLSGNGPAPPSEILACANGLVHLPSRRMLPHSPDFFTTNAVDYRFDRDAGDPIEWLEFLHGIWPDDPESIATLQEIFGLALTGDTSHQKAFLIVGPKRSGKGTIARVLTALLGKENVAGPTLTSLSQNFGLQALIGKPLAIISDARLGGRTDAHVIAERLLSITGEDSLTIDRKFKEAWTGRLSTRFLILSNELPQLTDASGALASRFIVLQMERSFYGSEDLGLTSRLMQELPNILRWAMDGRDRLAARGYFRQPESARQALSELEDLGSPIGAFLRERCIVEPRREVERDRFYQAWLDWCRQEGRDHPGTSITFGKQLRAAIPGIRTSQPRAAGGMRVRCYVGVGLDE